MVDFGFNVKFKHSPGAPLGFNDKSQASGFLLNNFPSAFFGADPGGHFPDDMNRVIMNNHYIRARYGDDVTELGEEIVNRARNLAPKYTGDLARTIRFTYNPATLVLTMKVGGLPAVARGGTVWYAQAIESGKIRVTSGHQHYLTLAIIATFAQRTVKGPREQWGQPHRKLDPDTYTYQDVPQTVVGAQAWRGGMFQWKRAHGSLRMRGRGNRGSEIKLQAVLHETGLKMRPRRTGATHLYDDIPMQPGDARAYAHGVEFIMAHGSPFDYRGQKIFFKKQAAAREKATRRGEIVSKFGSIRVHVHYPWSQSIWLPQAAGDVSQLSQVSPTGQMGKRPTEGIFRLLFKRRAPSTSPAGLAVSTARRRVALLASEDFMPRRSHVIKVNKDRVSRGLKKTTGKNIANIYRRKAIEAMDPYGQLRHWGQNPYQVYKDIHKGQGRLGKNIIRGQDIVTLRRRIGIDAVEKRHDPRHHLLEGDVPQSRIRSWAQDVRKYEFTKMQDEPDWIMELYRYALESRPDLFE